MTGLKLACINIERDNHLQRVETFLRAYQPDVLCLQEVSEPDIPLFEGLMGQKLAYAPMTRHSATGTIVGTALVARSPLQDIEIYYYKGDPAHVPSYRRTGEGASEVPDTSTLNHGLICATVEGFRIATTHLTWTMRSESTPEQLHDAENMLALAEAEAATHDGLVLCGDFNAARGKATFAKIASHFTDAIPPHYKTSMDLALHRVGHPVTGNPVEAAHMATYMVDGLFHTPNYKVADAKLNAGVSDHMAITATIMRA